MKSSPCYLASLVLVLAALVAVAPPARADAAADAIRLHGDFDLLLGRYVEGLAVDYAAWTASPDDVVALDCYLDELTALDPADWPQADALAYWINLYNAVTVKLILDNYPLASIKDLGGFLKKSPWKRKLVTVAGRELTLNDIENDIIRPTFADPRIHFALNCASQGCPPLQAAAYRPGSISAQLDAACKLAMNSDRWVRVAGGKVELTKIFDWYAGDFEVDGGSVLAFINRYRDEPLTGDPGDFSFMSYDWSLNRVQ